MLDAIALRTYDQARAWAAPSPGGATYARGGGFAGVPTFIKDTVDLAGFPTQFGSRIFKSANARRHDPFTRQLLAQGFNVIGKSRLPEFAFNATTECQDGTATANPWHTAYSAGGSSGGAAALVAAGVVPIAHWNDGGGSIRIPAAACGLVGLKASRNRLVDANISRFLPVNLVSEGVLTRSVRDTARFLAEAEKTFHNRRYRRVGLVEGPSARRLKVGLLLSAAWDTPVDADTQAVVLRTAHLLERAGHIVEPIDATLTKDYVDAFVRYWGFLSFSVARFGRWMFKGSDWDLSQYEALSLELMRFFQKEWYRIPSSVVALHKFKRFNQTHFAPFDAVLSPVVAHASPKLGYLSPRCPAEELLPRLTGYVGITPMQNAIGTPAISLPMGMTSTDRRPIGVQLSAQAGEEAVLLSLAFELEAQVDFPRIEVATS
jgi:amidase